MIKRILHCILVLIIPFSCILQDNLQTNYHAPLNIPLILAANFGELRPNHFHMGVDFKTNGVEGLSLYSIESGYISRIKISPYGYGKVIYIDHPNGITSVYAHCSKFLGKLDSIVKATQEKEQNFEIEIFFTAIDLPVKRGEIIALSGNSGSSTAPHLHFELRNTKTEEALNPLKYGFNISDHKAPEIKAVKVYSLTNEGYQIPGKSKIVNVTKGKYGYYIGGDLLQIPADFCLEHGGIGFAFDVVDYLDGAANVCGLYGNILKNGNDTVFCQAIDKISFDHSRYVNSHKDYHEYDQSKRKFHKSFKTQHNPLTIYLSNKLGVLNVKPGDSLSINYSAYDVKGNRTELKFKVRVLPGKMNATTTIFPSWKYFYPDSIYHFQNEQIEFTADKHTFYEPTVKNLSLTTPYSFGDPKQPIQYPVHVKMKLPVSSIDRSKYYISVISSASKSSVLTSTIEADFIVAESKFLGIFKINIDTIAPSLSPLNFQAVDSICKKLRLSWKVLENQTELVDYDLFIDGKWYVLEYESKGDYLFFDRPKELIGRHKMELIVKDSCGNVKVWVKEMGF